MSNNAIQIITPELLQPIIPAYNRDDMNSIVAMAQLASKSGDLPHCTAESVKQSIMEAVSFGLSPLSQNGQVYFIAYANRDSAYKQCKMIIGYRGMIQVAARHGWIINADLVYDNEEFAIEMYNARQSIKHKRAPFSAGKLIGGYATAYMIDHPDTLQIEAAAVSEFAKAEELSKRKGGGKQTPWDTWGDEMRKKFCIRRLWKKLPLTLEMQRVEAAIVANEDEQSPSFLALSTTQGNASDEPRIVQEIVVSPDDDEPIPDVADEPEEIKINGYVTEPMTADEKQRYEMQKYIGGFPIEKLTAAQLRNLKRSGGEVCEGVLYFSDKEKIPAAYRYLKQLGVHIA